MTNINGKMIRTILHTNSIRVVDGSKVIDVRDHGLGQAMHVFTRSHHHTVFTLPGWDIPEFGISSSRHAQALQRHTHKPRAALGVPWAATAPPATDVPIPTRTGGTITRESLAVASTPRSPFSPRSISLDIARYSRPSTHAHAPGA